jgi:hypothetical protein
MKTIIEYSLLVVFGLTLMCDLPGQGWERYYPEAFLPEIGLESPNGDFLLFSYSDMGNNGTFSPLLKRVTIDGKSIFSNELNVDSAQANSHLFALIGNDNSIYKINRGRNNNLPGNLDLIKYGPGGNELWREFLDFSSCKYFTRGALNDLWVVDVPQDQPDPNNQVSIFHRLDQNGLEIQEFEIGIHPVLDHIISFQKVNDGFLIFELENSDNPHNSDSIFYSIKKIDFLGYLEWEKTGLLNSYNCPINESYTVIDQDENLYVSYPVYSSTNQIRGFALVKFDKDGEVKWGKGYHLEYDDETFRNICFQPHDSTLSVAYSANTSEGNMPFLLKLDLSGNLIWDKRVGFNRGLWYNTIFAKSAIDGGFFLVGLANGSGSFLIKTNSEGFSVTNQLVGSASVNQDSCFYLEDNLKSKNAIFEIGDETGYSFYASIDSAGYFNAVVDTGSYHVTSSSFNGYWSICVDTLFTQFDTLFSKDTLNFILQPEVDCPSMGVTISTPFLRRCFDNTLYVNYCNEGTIPAQDAYVEITIDPRLEVTGSEIPWYAVNGNVYTFDLGDVDLFECGDFKIYTHLPCDSVELGQTLCLEAHIFPRLDLYPS